MIESSDSDATNLTTPPAGQPARKTGSFAGDVLKIVSGTVVAQAISVLASPVLSRLFLPDTFGVSSLFNSVTNIFNRLSCLRYEMSIMLPEKDEDAANLLGVSLSFALLTALLTVPAILFGKDFFMDLLRARALEPYVWLIPPTVLFGGINLALNYWNSRSHKFGRLSLRRITNSVVNVAVSLAAGLLGYRTAGGLIVGIFCGVAVSTLLLTFEIWRDDRALFARSLNVRSMLQGISRYRKFPLYDSWAVLLNSVSWQLPTFMLTYFFSAEVVGFYALGTRVLRLPMDLIGGSISQAFFPQAVESKIDGKLPEVVEGTFKRLVRFSSFPLLILAVIGRDLFAVVFGGNWAEAGLYTQILSVWMFFWFISSPMSQLFRVLEMQEFSLKINIVIFATRFLSLAAGGLFGDARLALALFSASGVLTYGYLSLAVVTAAGVPLGRIARILLSNFLLFVPVGAVLVLLVALGANPWIQIAAAALAGGIYYLYLIRSDPQLLQSLLKSRVGKRVLRTGRQA